MWMRNLERDLSRDCGAAFLSPIDKHTSMSMFFVSSDKTEAGYFCYALLEHLVDLHNQLCENIEKREVGLLLQRE